MESRVIYFSKTLAGFQRTARSYIQQNSTLCNHRCENLKSYAESYIVSLMVILVWGPHAPKFGMFQARLWNYGLCRCMEVCRSTTLKLEAALLSELSVSAYRSTRCHNPEDSKLNNQRRGSLTYAIYVATRRLRIF
jgi:hypothetical protein